MSQSTDTYLLLLWEPFRVSPPGSPRPSAAPPPLPAAFGWPVTKARESHEDLQCRVIKGVSEDLWLLPQHNFDIYLLQWEIWRQKSVWMPWSTSRPHPSSSGTGISHGDKLYIYISPRGFWMRVVFLGALAFNSAHGTSGTIPGVELRVELKLWGPQTCLHPIFPGWIRRYLLNSGLEQQAWISMWAGHSFLGLSCGWP